MDTATLSHIENHIYQVSLIFQGMSLNTIRPHPKFLSPRERNFEGHALDLTYEIFSSHSKNQKY